jgi:hypothetical protein
MLTRRVTVFFNIFISASLLQTLRSSFVTMSGYKVTSAILLLVCLLLTAQTVAAQPQSKATDRSTLRARFTEAFSKDFLLIDDQLKTRAVERGGGTYWLAFVKPKHTGYFSLQYRYREGEPLESREHENHFSIGPQGCRRGPPYSGVYGRFCLGDTIIVPVLVNNYSGHEFKLAKAEYTDGSEDPPISGIDAQGLDKAAVTNPAAPMMRYAGRSAYKMLHRIPGYTLILSAQFQAQEPGRMNLVVTAEGPSTPSARGFDGAPIIVLPRDAPATLIAGREEVRGYRKGFDGKEYVASTSGNSYMTNVMILQPGDRIDVSYFSIVRRSDFVGGRFSETGPDASENLKPVISARPFAPDTRYDFTEWIVNYLRRP